MILILFAFEVGAEASKGARIRSVKKVASRKYMYECATSYDDLKGPVTVHAEYFKACNSLKEHGPVCRLELSDGSNTQLEKFISDFQRDIRKGNASGKSIRECPDQLGSIREIMDSNGCTAKVSICYPAKYVQNKSLKPLKSDRAPASISKPKPKRINIKF